MQFRKHMKQCVSLCLIFLMFALYGCNTVMRSAAAGAAGSATASALSGRSGDDIMRDAGIGAASGAAAGFVFNLF